jgi:hypothetical protein
VCPPPKWISQFHLQGMYILRETRSSLPVLDINIVFLSPVL